MANMICPYRDPEIDFDDFIFTGYGAANGQTANVYKYGKVCILSFNGLSLSKIPVNGDIINNHNYAIGSVKKDSVSITTKAISYSIASITLYGAPTIDISLVIYTDGTVCAIPGSGTYQSNMTLRGSIVFFTE